MLPKNCKVCGRTQRNSCLKYGGQACVACATFFIRYFNRRNKKNSCRNFNLCLAIPSQKGTSCWKYRYQKCLDIGMINKKVAKIEKDRITKCGEYYDLSKTLNNLFITIRESPILLFNYFESVDVTLFDKAFELLPHSPLPNYLLPWAELLKSNEVAFDKIYILFYSILCKIKLSFLNPQDQLRLLDLQKISAQNYLVSDLYEANKELQEGFRKLSDFFASEYQIFFC